MRMTDKIDIRDTAKLGQIRAGMVDANRLNYQMAINGGYKPMAIGRQGLKIDPERLAEAKRIAKCIK
jgi:predicted RecB family endonuclease